MKTKKIALMFCMVLLCCSGTILYAQSESTEGRPRIGVILDMEPLPDLLIKHLRLEPGQGIRIINVQQNSPADKVGLERDDIIIGFEEQQIKSNEQLIDAVQQAGVGKEVTLKIIHLGLRKDIKLKLEEIKDRPELKYPSEPDFFQSWRPGKIFKFNPGEKGWMEMKMPFDDKSFDVYSYHHSDNGEDYSINIEGNPDDEDTKITVRIGNDEYQTTVGQIDKLPEKYHQVAQKALENSRKHSKQRIEGKTKKFFSIPLKPEEFFKRFEKMDRYHISPDDLRLRKLSPDNRIFDKIEEQMRKLQERLDELEKRFKDTPERSSKKESGKEQI
ncbi:MAG: PDZ domain-containing protein [Sedimentisphaerales bacterium]|nr:PDZ domain-containing protein [Sedimentisphaerales bacterium]